MRVVSFSGGRTSAILAMLERGRPDYDPEKWKFVFMNTGEEDERTLEFVRRCDTEFELGVVWLEAVIDPHPRKGTRHRAVTFETATRGAALFGALAEKYGIPNKNFPHCTRELKLRPFESYRRTEGITNYTTVSGIRSDGIDRINPKYAELRLDYPMARGWTKEMVRCLWSFMPFDLGLSEHRGKLPRMLEKVTSKAHDPGCRRPGSLRWVQKARKLRHAWRGLHRRAS